jgi:hypothetical protein
MYLAPGTLDQRLRFYRRRDAGADGFSRPVYEFTLERWGRVDAVSDRATVPLAPQAHVEHRTDAVATIAEGIAVDPNGLVKLGADLYFVRGVVRIRQLRCQRITLEAIDPTAYAMFQLHEGADVLDGLHLVDPSTGVVALGFLLLEDGNYLLLEDGGRIKLESGAIVNAFNAGFSNGFA